MSRRPRLPFWMLFAAAVSTLVVTAADIWALAVFGASPWGIAVLVGIATANAALLLWFRRRRAGGEEDALQGADKAAIEGAGAPYIAPFPPCGSSAPSELAHEPPEDSVEGGDRGRSYALGPEAAEPVPSPASSRYQLMALYPAAIPPQGWSPLWTYLYSRAELGEVAEDADLLARERGPLTFSSASTDKELARGAVLTVTPRGDGLRFDPPKQTAVWLGRWRRFDFRVEVAGEPAAEALRGTVAFTVEGLLVGDVPFELRVGGAAAADGWNRSSHGRLYDKIFPSYSHQDTQIVERLERAYRALGLTYLRDVTTLRSGQQWVPELLRFIAEADAFQLFWSSASAASPYVTEEWQAAVRLVAGKQKEETFIRPVYWQQPMPSPPQPLREIHFAYEPDLER